MTRSSWRHPEMVVVKLWVTCEKCKRQFKDERMWRQTNLRPTAVRCGEFVEYTMVVDSDTHTYACMDCARDEVVAVDILGLSNGDWQHPLPKAEPVPRKRGWRWWFG